jgi:hypothetical protein
VPAYHRGVSPDWRIPILLASTFLGAVSACGEGDDSPEEAYADELEDIDAEFNDSFDEPQSEDAAAILDLFENSYTSLLTGLEGLEPPGAVQEQHADYEQAAENVLAVVDDARADVENGSGVFEALLEGERSDAWSAVSESCLRLEEAANGADIEVDLECVEGVGELPA